MGRLRYHLLSAAPAGDYWNQMLAHRIEIVPFAAAQLSRLRPRETVLVGWEPMTHSAPYQGLVRIEPWLVRHGYAFDRFSEPMGCHDGYLRVFRPHICDRTFICRYDKGILGELTRRGASVCHLLSPLRDIAPLDGEMPLFMGMWKPLQVKAERVSGRLPQ